MKSKIFKPTFILVALLTLLITSCKKDETNEEGKNDIQLLKISSWNPSTGAENIGTEFTYETNGRIKTVTSARVNLTATYNSAGKVTSLNGLNSTGGAVSYTLEYNAGGQISKVTYVYMNPSNYGNVKTYTYNTTGKLIQVSTVSSESGAGSTPSVMNYTWNGDNLATSSYPSGNGTNTTTYVSYDDKLNPYSLGDGIASIISGSPASKNNVTEISSTLTGQTYTQKRSYEYNASGYATSMKLLDGSNEGSKFYYNK